MTWHDMAWIDMTWRDVTLHDLTWPEMCIQSVGVKLKKCCVIVIVCVHFFLFLFVFVRHPSSAFEKIVRESIVLSKARCNIRNKNVLEGQYNSWPNLCVRVWEVASPRLACESVSKLCVNKVSVWDWKGEEGEGREVWGVLVVSLCVLHFPSNTTSAIPTTHIKAILLES